MFTLTHLGSAKIIAALLVAVTVLCAADQAKADTESLERAWKEGDFETVLKKLQPLVDAGNVEAIKAAEFAKFMLELQERVLAYRNAEGPIDLRDFDGRYEPMVPGPQQRRFALGQEAYERDDYETAFREWLPLADGGYAEAQHQIAFLFELGKGTEKDAAKAEAYYLKAAQQGYAPAQARLAQFNNGLFLSEDEEAQRRVFRWGMRAAVNGDAGGYLAVSIAYCYGLGVDRNPVLSDIWLYMIFPSQSYIHDNRCSENVKYPKSYFNAIRERAEAMSKAYDIPIFEE